MRLKRFSAIEHESFCTPIAHPRTASLVSFCGNSVFSVVNVSSASFAGAEAEHATALGGGVGHRIFLGPNRRVRGGRPRMPIRWQMTTQRTSHRKLRIGG